MNRTTISHEAGDTIQADWGRGDGWEHYGNLYSDLEFAEAKRIVNGGTPRWFSSRVDRKTVKFRIVNSSGVEKMSEK
jgi:hypothetical protein